MKLKYLVIVAIVASLSLLTATYKPLEAKSAGVQASYTGAPSSTFGTEQTCKVNGCHNTYEVDSGPGSLTVEQKSGWGGYTPGEPQEIKVKIAQAGSYRFGFQAVAIKEYSSSVKRQAGEMQLITPLTTQILEANAIFGNMAGRQYVTHTFDGNAGEESREWSFLWVPHDTTTGDVTIYVTAVGANSDLDVDSDYVYTDTLYLRQVPLSVNEYNQTDVKVFPTLVTDFINVVASEKTQITIYNIQGQQVYANRNGLGKTHDLSNLSAGQYIYTIATENEILKTGKLIRK